MKWHSTMPSVMLLALLLAGAGLGVDARAQEEKQEPAKGVPAALPKGKKLVLKDGSFQLVREYEQKGDRVRFYSVERSGWEEIPAELVDWEATRRAEKEAVQRKEEALEQLRAIEMAERAATIDVDASIEVAPGVFLPENEGLFVLDGRAVLPLTQLLSEIKRDKGQTLKQILIPIPIIPTRHRVSVPGKRALLRLTTGQPEFYMRTADDREPELELIRARVRGDAREVEVLNTHITGDQVGERQTISVERWQVARRVWKLTVSQSLEPGEYAIAEILPGEGMNYYVWDFGVDRPAAKK
jgi:hypothetical protein